MHAWKKLLISGLGTRDKSQEGQQGLNKKKIRTSPFWPILFKKIQQVFLLGFYLRSIESQVNLGFGRVKPSQPFHYFS